MSVLVFGSINVDGVITADHLAEEGETAFADSYDLLPGGKGANQAVAAARAGAAVSMVAMVGPDAHAEVGLAGLRAAGVDVSGVGTGEKATGYGAVWVRAGGGNRIMVASGANMETRAAMVPDDRLARGDVLLLQLEVPFEETVAIAGRAAEAGLTVMLNAAPFRDLPADLLDALSVLIVNEVEAAALAGKAGLATDDPLTAVRTLARRHDLACIATLGADGAIGWQGEAGWRSGTLAVEAVDSTGAGDAFCGAVAAALDRGLTPAEATREGCIAGALACEKIGAQSALPDAGAIRTRLATLPPLETLS